MGPLANGSFCNLAFGVPNYRCTNFGAFIKKYTIDQLNRSTIRGFVSNKNFVSGFVSGFVSDFVCGFVSGRAFLTLPENVKIGVMLSFCTGESFIE